MDVYDLSDKRPGYADWSSVPTETRECPLLSVAARSFQNPRRTPYCSARAPLCPVSMVITRASPVALSRRDSLHRIEHHGFVVEKFGVHQKPMECIVDALGKRILFGEEFP